MHAQMIEVGDRHAELWGGITEFHHRHIAGPEDVTIATHPALGLCVISHRGLGDQVQWVTQRPIPVAGEWDDMLGDALDDMLDGLDVMLQRSK